MKKKKFKPPQKFLFLTPGDYRSLSHEGRLRYVAAIAQQLQQIRAMIDAKRPVQRDEVRPAKNKRAHP